MNLLNIISMTSLLLLALLMLSFILLLSVAIVFNTRAGMKYRETLAAQLEQLRLGKMLTALGIDTDSYLSRERAVDIRQHMQRCNSCSNTQECDSRLAVNNVDTETIDYCNNEASLRKLSGQINNTP
ncbi:DUF6455 family protein [Gammaproteobacteria bacterium]|nr:DUF6455 family protein [Gammaproteobacteria bacterium]